MPTKLYHEQQGSGAAVCLPIRVLRTGRACLWYVNQPLGLKTQILGKLDE